MMMKIGEFARENRVTVRTLHHYEALELLMPARIDGTNGYRLYEPEQAERLRVIQIFKDLGFSLSEISSLLKGEVGREELIALLNRKYVQARMDRLNGLIRCLGLEVWLEKLRKLPEGSPVNFKEVSDLDIEVKGKGIPEQESLIDSFRLILEKAGQEKRSITLMVIDIDRFGEVNGQFGPPVGDAVIDAVRRVIGKESPEGSGLFWGHLSVMEHRGGDEFLNWVECSPEEGRTWAEKIRSSVEGIDFSYLGMNRPVTLSIGVVHSEGECLFYEDFIRQGDGALSEAKLKGRNRVEELSL
ncbi:MAG: diguanylate cyclase [Spirochaetales bacterium]|nr:diguanylate cyclase [Spirochaetales bacterium]